MPCSNRKKEHGDFRLLIKTENKRKLLANYGEEQYDWILKKAFSIVTGSPVIIRKISMFSLDKNLFKINRINLNLNAKIANIREQT